MGMELVEIQQQILRFTFELKKQSSCTIQLTNKTDQFVAFKVKTTSPKKYCVKPNVGVIKPRGKSGFTVIMQAQTSAPPDFLCKDKFLVQTTVVAFGLTEDNITSDMFVKDPSKNIHEKKLKVILVHPQVVPIESPPPPPPLLKQDQKIKPHANLLPSYKEEEGVQSTKKKEETKVDEAADEFRAVNYDDEKIPNAEMDAKSGSEVDDLSLKLTDLGSKLLEVEEAVTHLTEERNRAMHEKEMLEQEMEMARSQSIVKRVYMGYPFLYVCMVGICSLTFGYLVHH